MSGKLGTIVNCTGKVLLVVSPQNGEVLQRHEPKGEAVLLSNSRIVTKVGNNELEGLPQVEGRHTYVVSRGVQLAALRRGNVVCPDEVILETDREIYFSTLKGN